MADINVLVPFILSFEGGYVNDPDDRGGATNKGVTISTWKRAGYDKNHDHRIDCEDIKLITEQDMKDVILKPHYWDRVRADEIKDQSVANILVDWVWASGIYAIKSVQGLLGLTQDGIVGPKTLSAINNSDPERLFWKIHKQRDIHFRMCAARPGQGKFLKGWIRRLNSIKYNQLILNR